MVHQIIAASVLQLWGTSKPVFHGLRPLSSVGDWQLALALRSEMWLDCRRARKTASCRVEVAWQSADMKNSWYRSPLSFMLEKMNQMYGLIPLSGPQRVYGKTTNISGPLAAIGIQLSVENDRGKPNCQYNQRSCMHLD